MLLFPDLPSLKLVEPGYDEGVVRVETMVRVSGVLGSGSGYRVSVVVSTQPFASLTCWLNQLQKRKALTCWLNRFREMKYSCWLNRLRGARFRFSSPPLPPQFRGVRDGRSGAG